MAFLHPSLYKTQAKFLISDELEDAIISVNLPVGDYDIDDLDDCDPDLKEDIIAVAKEYKVTRFEIRLCFYGLMEPYGCYTDRSDFILGDSIKEVAQQILDLYYDGDPEYWDADEKSEYEWLMGYVK